ncbi:MAG: hypothetical protein WCY97_06655 [Methanothrix sp.]|uniref:DUF4440 domain-containing protein n=1 Tax=Methanothrix harundinacea TaxID=301375 RepID=A0A101FTM4_9EURY|nr:MAG: hypothetical protein APR56_12320 [Methanosaeta sp. SDB]KUK44250.1 MAG: Uncharacterized protein XD72_1382 [Methanothrix harundinacea]MDD2638317.1 hypothetical protein [Methanothrix sp.]MDI9399791.1 hypothetical protein [Euryarchaeota archaeon]KUK96334.1 MAG: Uncharacterized protein XE07_1176 [Methanothrix harundinacea]
MDFEESGQDLRMIEELTNSLYSCISFRQGEKPELARLKSLFIKEGILINNNDDPLIFTIYQFVEAIEEQLSAGSLRSFSEREVAERTDIFGKVAHRFSTYEARFDPDDPEPLTVGINSIQLVKVDGSWRVSSIVWNDESESRRIPEKYNSNLRDGGTDRPTG